MKLEFRSNGVRISEALAEHAERRLRFALGRFGERVRRVRVQLTDVNGPRGGEDIQCRVLASLAPHGELVIQEVNHDPFAAVARASDRAGHSLSRHVRRIRARRRGRR